EIPVIIEGFVDCAKRLERCGWDGIEVTSFGGHLIEQFWSPKLNKRKDKYGGSFEGRMRFSIEIIQAIEKVVSKNFIISLRLTGDPLTDELGLSENDMLKIAKRHDELNRINLFSISGGTGANYKAQTGVVPGESYNRGAFNTSAQKMKDQLSAPVIGAGRILDPDQAEEGLKNNCFDLVGM